MHMEATLKYSAYINREDVVARLRNDKAQCQARSRLALEKIIQSIKFLARQGLALQGHDNESGNLYDLLRLRSHDIPELANWLSRKH